VFSKSPIGAFRKSFITDLGLLPLIFENEPHSLKIRGFFYNLSTRESSILKEKTSLDETEGSEEKISSKMRT
jgi:hypothetical protein